MNRFVQSAIAVSAVLVGCSAAIAGPVTYDESVSGDLDAANPKTFVLDAGTNSIVGRTGFYPQSASPGYSDDRDSFFVQVSGGVLVTSASLTLTRDYGNLFGFEWLVVKDGDWAHPPSITADGAGTKAISVDLSPGLYYFHHGSMGGSIGSEYDYRFEFNAVGSTATVPEPGSCSAVAAALASLVFVRRRKDQA